MRSVFTILRSQGVSMSSCSFKMGGPELSLTSAMSSKLSLFMLSSGMIIKSPSSPLARMMSTAADGAPNSSPASSSPQSASPTVASSASLAKERGVATKKHRIVVLGVGWGGYEFLRKVDRRYYEVICISPRNHFLFTPLLTSTTVGTLEFRAIVEPVRELHDVHYHQAEAQTIDFKDQKVHCLDTVHPSHQSYSVSYDSLIIAVGTCPNTFNTPGVTESNHVFFLKQLNDARKIRECLLERFEEASSEHLSAAERDRLSRIVVVGGGPTSVEFASELYDFVKSDAGKAFPGLKSEIVVVEGSDHILGSFDRKLSEYTMNLFRTRPNIKLMLNSRVTGLEDGKVHLANGDTLQCGLVVWGAGVRALPFIEQLKSVLKDKRSQRIITNSHFQVMHQSSESDNAKEFAVPYANVFAIGDCAFLEGSPLAQTAQVASQEGSYLAKLFNSFTKSGSNTVPSAEQFKPFTYRYLGMLAYVGGYKAISDLNYEHGKWSGIKAFLLWRSAYWTRTVSWRNKFLIPMLWIKTFLFGRDITRF